MSQKILVLLENGFEEIETLASVDLMRRAGLEVTLAACGAELMATGKMGVRVVADALLKDCDSASFGVLVIPGGPAAMTLRKNPKILELVRSFDGRGCLIAAICAAPVVLHDAGILDGKQYTAHFSVAEELTEIRPDAVVVDGQLITSQGAGTAVEFGLAIVAKLLGSDQSQEIRNAICAPEGCGIEV